MASEYACHKVMTSAPMVLLLLTIGKDWSQYDNEYKLRTDAVWEKQQLKDWFRLTNKVIRYAIFRCSISINLNLNINSLSLMMFIPYFSNLGVMIKNKSWTGMGILLLDVLLASKPESVPSRRSRIPLTVFTLCLITMSCAL